MFLGGSQRAPDRTVQVMLVPPNRELTKPGRAFRRLHELGASIITGLLKPSRALRSEVLRKELATYEEVGHILPRPYKGKPYTNSPALLL